MPSKRFILRVLLVFVLATELASAQSLPASVEQALKRAHIPLSGVAAYVQGVDNSEPLVAHNAAQAMNPASTIKLLTTYAALSCSAPPTPGRPRPMPAARSKAACSRAI